MYVVIINVINEKPVQSGDHTVHHMMMIASCKLQHPYIDFDAQIGFIYQFKSSRLVAQNDFMKRRP